MGKRDDRIHAVQFGRFSEYGFFGSAVFRTELAACGVRRDHERLSNKAEKVTCDECIIKVIGYYSQVIDSMARLIESYPDNPTRESDPEGAQIIEGAKETIELAEKALLPWQKKKACPFETLSEIQLSKNPNAASLGYEAYLSAQHAPPRPVSHCTDHTRYTAGCTQCKAVRAEYRQTRRSADRRDHLARAAAYQKLAAAHPDEYRRYFNEEVEMGSAPTEEKNGNA